MELETTKIEIINGCWIRVHNRTCNLPVSSFRANNYFWFRSRLVSHERHNAIFQPSKIELFLDEIEENFIVHSMFHFIQVLSNHL